MRAITVGRRTCVCSLFPPKSRRAIFRSNAGYSGDAQTYPDGPSTRANGFRAIILRSTPIRRPRDRVLFPFGVNYARPARCIRVPTTPHPSRPRVYGRKQIHSGYVQLHRRDSRAPHTRTRCTFEREQLRRRSRGARPTWPFNGSNCRQLFVDGLAGRKMPFSNDDP